MLDKDESGFTTAVLHEKLPCGKCTPTGPYLSGHDLIGHTIREVSSEYKNGMATLCNLNPSLFLRVYMEPYPIVPLEGRRQIPMHSYWRHN